MVCKPKKIEHLKEKNLHWQRYPCQPLFASLPTDRKNSLLHRKNIKLFFLTFLKNHLLRSKSNSTTIKFALIFNGWQSQFICSCSKQDRLLELSWMCQVFGGIWLWLDRCSLCFWRDDGWGHFSYLTQVLSWTSTYGLVSPGREFALIFVYFLFKVTMHCIINWLCN